MCAQNTTLDPGATLLRGYAESCDLELLAALTDVVAVAPFRHMMTPSGWFMSVAISNCGDLGWITDRSGYRYDSIDPTTARRWPSMPSVCADLATKAAQSAGYERFAPDACLINRYEAGARLSLHQDKDENDFAQPIVSVSLGVPATLLWGGLKRANRPRLVPLFHGDVVVWGGPSRLYFHGVRKLAQGSHPLTGALRYNLTFRKAR